MHKLKGSRRCSVAALVAAVAAVLLPAGPAAAVPFAPAPMAAAAAPVVRPAATPALDVVPEAAVAVDVLPTVQIDGVAWSQAAVGTTVYAGGEFTTARPAGAAPGVDTVGRKNLLAYDVTTGVLQSAFNPWVNASVLVVAASPDGRRVYIGGHFLKADGIARSKLAAYDTTTGRLVAEFAPQLNDAVRALYVTNDRIYVGGSFTTANGVARQRLAAFDLNGTLLNWAPSVNRQVDAMVMNPAGTKLVVGGRFDQLNGVLRHGLRAVDPATGAELSWAAGAQIRSGFDPSTGVTSLATDGTKVYGTSFATGAGHPVEGPYAMHPDTGELLWVNDCHGDSYSVHPFGGQLYLAGHSHGCDNVEAFPEMAPTAYWRGVAFTTEADRINRKNSLSPDNFGNWGGTPAPAMISWFPTMDKGTFTGMNQGPWHVTSTADYLLMAGEFPRVNSIGQQGLVRFARRGVGPDDVGPEAHAALKPVLRGTDPGTVQVSWQTAWDRDDRALTYKVFRNGDLASPIHTVSAPSRHWDQPWLSFEDTGREPGTTVGYRVFAYDAAGNETQSGTSTIVVDAGTAPHDALRARVVADGAGAFWRLREPGGPTAWDSAGGTPAAVSAGVVRGVEAGTASGFTGTAASSIVAPHRTWGPDVFTVQAWFSTTATRGGQLVGFGSAVSGVSGVSDRSIYLTDDGRLGFALSEEGVMRSVVTAAGFRDGQRHQVSATYDGAVMRLYVDGRLQETGSARLTGHQYGNWRIGGDRVAGVQAAPSSPWFTGSLWDVGVYPTALSAGAVDGQWVAGGGVSTAPTDSYGLAVVLDSPSLYWRFDETAGTVAADTAGAGRTGDHLGAAAVQRGPGAITGGGAVGFDGSGQYVASRTASSGLTDFSAEAWVRTSSTSGGPILGFGTDRATPTGARQPQVFLQDSGLVAFGALTGGEVHLVSPVPINDGRWHHVVATRSAIGMRLFVDGVEVARNSTATAAATGHLKVGGDRGWVGATSGYLAGDIDEVALYPHALDAGRVSDHFWIGRYGAPNAAPVAAFAATPSELTVQVDGSASSDQTGEIVGHLWDFGDGTTATGVTAEHVYGGAGSYEIALTVTDNGGLSHRITQQVTVLAPNLPPVAAFTAVVEGSELTVDASGSADPDGQIVAHDWSFGDGATATGPSAVHVLPGPGSWTVTLRVTDDRGGTHEAVQQVTVVAPPAELAVDLFDREVVGGFGDAPVGGSWISTGAAQGFSVTSGAARMQLSGPGETDRAQLTGVSARDVDLRLDLATDRIANGNGLYLSAVARRIGNSDYRAKLRILPNGQVTVGLSRTVGTTETSLGSVVVTGLRAEPGVPLRLRLQVRDSAVVGQSELAAKAWPAIGAEPGAWQVTANDATPGLQVAGTVGFAAYLASNATTVPLAVAVDEFHVLEAE